MVAGDGDPDMAQLMAVLAGRRPASRVWLRTSSLDHPNAIGNYRRRGFKVAAESTAPKLVPDPRVPPWPLPHDPRTVPRRHEEELIT